MHFWSGRDLFAMKHPGRATMTSATKKLIMYLGLIDLDPDVVVGSFVMLHVARDPDVHVRGRARYIGPLEGKEGTWVGAELDEPAWGKNNGTVFGRCYFNCPAGYGLFIRQQHVEALPVEALPVGREGVGGRTDGRGPAVAIPDWLAVGAVVDYRDRDGNIHRAKVLKFHFEDPPEVYFTILVGTTEKQTTLERLSFHFADADMEDDLEPAEQVEPDHKDGGTFWDLGGLLFAEIKSTKVKGSREATWCAFVTELLKTKAGKGHGRYGPAAFAELLTRCREHGVTQIQLVVRRYRDAEDKAKGIAWKKTTAAYELYEELGFRVATASDPLLYPQPDDVGLLMLVVDVETLAVRLRTAQPLTGGARWLQTQQCRAASNADSMYFEKEAIAAMVEEHDLANDGDGAEPMKELIPRARGRNVNVMLYAMVPRQTADGNPQDDAGVTEDAVPPRPEAGVGDEQEVDRASPDDFDHEVGVTRDGEVVRDYDAGDAPPASLLLERLRGQVHLSNRSRGVGAKCSADAASVRRAAKNHKQWSTAIVQILNKLIEQLFELQDNGLIMPEHISSMPPCLIKLGDETDLVPATSARGGLP